MKKNEMAVSKSPGLPQRSDRAPMARRRPEMDVFETGDEYVVRADMPGVSEKDLTVQIDRNELHISGMRARTATGEALFTVPRDVEYVRRIGLPDGIDADKVEAKFDGGVLSVHLPKRANLRPRKIEVRAQA